jgi:biotin carboxyl carrier protein
MSADERDMPAKQQQAADKHPITTPSLSKIYLRLIQEGEKVHQSQAM